MQKRGTTRLSMIPGHLIWAEGQHGHSFPVKVAALLDRPSPPETVADAVDAMRCVKCRTRQIKSYRLVYQGGSANAMDGAATEVERVEGVRVDYLD